MVPYFIAFLLVGIPLALVEWSLGRHGGRYSHGSAPGILSAVTGKPYAKYLGVLGLFGPLIIVFYYTFIESWTLAYSVLSLLGRYRDIDNMSDMTRFLRGFQGVEKNEFFSGIWVAYLFFLITFFINFVIIYRGIVKGIEKFCKFAMPVLLLAAVVLVLRVLTLPRSPEGRGVVEGLGFMWNPDFSVLGHARVWLAATGQILFTLSVGIGVILTYASYLRNDDDVALPGVAAAGMNEFAEVILGGSIIIPAAFIFFGSQGALEVAQSGSFNIGFVTMPMIFNQVPLGWLFGFCWFLLLFLAGITSSISLLQPAISFLEDELGLSRKRAVVLMGFICFIACQFGIFGLAAGVVDEFDFWGGTVCLVLFGTIEVLVFSLCFGRKKGWQIIMHGSELKLPEVFSYIITYVTPLFLIAILITWLYQDWWSTITMEGIEDPGARRTILLIRIGLVLFFAFLALLVGWTWRRKEQLKGTRS